MGNQPNKDETGIREYVEGEPVRIKEKNGRLIIEAFNEGGHNSTEVDLVDVIEWVKANRPDLIESDLTEDMFFFHVSEGERWL